MDTPSEADLLAFLDGEMDKDLMSMGFAGVSVERVAKAPNGPSVHHLGDVLLTRTASELELLRMTSVAELFRHPEVGAEVGRVMADDFADSVRVLITQPAGLLGAVSGSDDAVLYDSRWRSEIELRDPRRYRLLAMTVSFVPTAGLSQEAVRFGRGRRTTRLTLHRTSAVLREGPEWHFRAQVAVHRVGKALEPGARISTL